jgi:hypothetical protein
VVDRKRPVHVAEHRDGIQPQGLHRFESQRAACSVARVDRESEVVSAELDVGRRFCHVGRRRVDDLERSPGADSEFLVLHDGAELVDVVAVE